MLTVRTRRNVSLVLFIGLLLVSAAVWSMSTQADIMKDGTYTGKAKGFGGELIVDVTITGGKISDVAVRPHQETPFVAGPAIEQLTAGIVQAQSANVQAVSGATITSKALVTATEQALQKALGKYEDGVYAGSAQGFGGKLVVDVTISDGKISDVAVRPHQETPAVAGPAIEALAKTIVEKQSANVEVITGATVSSKALMAAVEEALNGTGEVVEEAVAGAGEGFEIKVGDGTHRASAQGFGGNLVLDVTVSGGKITEIVIVENSETPFIAGNALEKLPAAIVEAQGPVDVVSGATVTSKAILEAVEKAVAGSASEGYAIAVGDGTHRASVQGFGGDLVLDVTVSGGKITEIVIVENSETPFIAGNALEKLPAAIVEAQGPVDAVSGATVTSKAIFEAVEKAVAGFASEGYAIAVGDGTHRASAQGFGGHLVVDVTVSGGKITEIVIVENSETPFIAGNALEKLPAAIVEAQGPVDAVSGATVTSKAILEAVEKAVAGSASEGYAIAVGDGTHRASVQGFGGDLVLDVTVSGGKITEIVIVENSETPFIAGNALEKLPAAIVEAQGPVDVVSGATVTSKAILEAVEKAVTGGQAAEVTSEPAPSAPYVITVGDGIHRGTAQGFGGELTVDVTVSGGRITEIVIVENSETPFIAKNAFEKLPPAIIEAQGPVDVVSGATATSKAVLAAVEDAIN